MPSLTTIVRLLPLTLLAVVGTVGCMSLTKEGAKVRVITGDPANDCTEMGTVNGFGLGTTNGYEYAQNALRDEAGRKGATHVRIENKSTTSTGDTEVTGIAFRCPEAAPPAEIH
jgi:hypothetical protein